MTRPVTFTDAPDTVLPAELNDIQDDYESYVKQRQLIHTGSWSRLTGNAASDQVVGYLGGHEAVASNLFSPRGGTIFYYNKEDWRTSVGGRTPRVMIRAVFTKSGPVTTQTVLVKIDRITATAGASSAHNMTLTNFASSNTATAWLQLGAVDTLSNGSFHVSNVFQPDQNTGNWPAGWYALRVVTVNTVGGTGGYYMSFNVLAWAE